MTKSPFPRVHEKRLSVGISKRHLGHAIVGHSTPLDAAGVPLDIDDDTVAKDGGPTGATSTVLDPDFPIAENDDPLKRRVNSGPRMKGLARKLYRLVTLPKRVYRMFRPPLTPEEALQAEEEQRAKAFFRVMSADAFEIANRLSAKLGRLEFKQMVGREGHKREKLIKFDKISWDRTGQEVILHMNDAASPDGVWTTKLGTEQVATECRVSVGHPVSVKADTYGTCFHVDRAGTMGLPKEVFFRDILPLRPAAALPLTFFAGTRSNGGREWRSLEAINHFIGAGSTGGGKSTYMHQMLCTFISANKPEDVLVIPIDLKFGGVALTRYEGIPHIITREKLPAGIPDDVRSNYPVTGIATDLASADATLNFALTEIERRGALFLGDTKYRPQKIEDWNKHHKTRRLPRIVIFVDELAEAMDKSDVDSKTELTLIKSCRYSIRKILKLARSSGVHLVSFTQSLDKSVMGVVFKTNVGGRICFGVPDVTGSILVIGDGEAVNLFPPGRGVFKHGHDRFVCQTPLITEAEINVIVQKVKSGQIVTKLAAQAVTPEDLIRHAVQENSGTLPERELYTHFGSQIEMNALRKILQEMTDQEYQVDEYTYRVLPGLGRRPRRVERVDQAKSARK